VEGERWKRQAQVRLLMPKGKKSPKNRPVLKRTIKIIGAAFFLAIFASVNMPRTTAADSPPTAVRQRLAMEQAAWDNPFLLLPHRPNYILPVIYNSTPNDEPFGFEPGTFDELEMKFQVSLKVQLGDRIFGEVGSLYAAYTNRSWWQAYNSDRSSPFRETNHEPELFLLWDTDWHFMGMRASSLIVGVSHQSNGQGGAISRSWNRLFLNLILERGSIVLSLKPWYRVPESDKEDPGDPGGDDNPDIGRYMGSGELGLLYRKKRNTLTLLVRNNLKPDNRGAVVIGWSYPLSRRIKGYLQFFDGYGESLIDYDHRNTRIGAGFLLADWL
jgi:phospholipase A1